MFWSEKPLGTTLVQFEREDLFVMQMNSTWLCVWAELCLFQRQIAILTFDKCLCLSCICAFSCWFWLYFVFVLYSPTTSFRLDFWLFICIFFSLSCILQRQIALLTFYLYFLSLCLSCILQRQVALLTFDFLSVYLSLPCILQRQIALLNFGFLSVFFVIIMTMLTVFLSKSFKPFP